MEFRFDPSICNSGEALRSELGRLEDVLCGEIIGGIS
jgi:hypothetical protein